MSENINVTLPDNIARYLHMRSRSEYLPMSAIVRKYVAKSVVEEMVIHYHEVGYSIGRMAELTDTPITRIMDILRGMDEEIGDIDEEMGLIEKGEI
jgi:hypothetical protein